MCPRTLCTLAHVFESAGLSTVVLTPMKELAERMKAPRTLHTDFPVGLSLGKPRDNKFQHEVLQAAFDLLQEPEGPVIKEFPVSISSVGNEPLVCSLHQE